MSNNTPSNNGNGSSFIKKYIAVCAVLDIIWATLLATFGATILHAIGVSAGATAGTTTTASVLGWIITFAVGLFQGAIFLTVISIFGVVFIAIFGSRKSGNGPGDSGTK